MRTKNHENRKLKKVIYQLLILIISSTLIGSTIVISLPTYSLSVYTDEFYYYPGESVKISGKLTHNGSGVGGAAVCIKIENPDGNQVFSICISTSSSGKFSTTYSSGSKQGSYHISAEATQSGAKSGSGFRVVSTNVDAFTNGPYYGAANLPVNFSGEAEGGKPPYTWLWDFGNDRFSNEEDPLYSYQNPGNYTVTLLAEDDGIYSGEDTTYALIAEEFIVTAIGPTMAGYNDPIDFIGSASGGFSPYTWHWDFGDGNSSTEQNTIHIYPELGVYLVTLIVTDDKGVTSTDTIDLEIVSNRAPNKPTIAGPQTGNAKEEYEYTFSTEDPDGDDVYYWILWYDGCPGVLWEGPYSSSEEITRTYGWENEGNFTLRVKVKDIHDMESSWETLEITMPKTKERTSLLFRFLENHPIIQEILKNIFN